jgi:hypothetical protein
LLVVNIYCLIQSTLLPCLRFFIEEIMKLRVLVGSALLALATLPSSAAARIGEAEVREGPRGGPCFTISPREEKQGTPDFRGVTVSDGRRQLWKMSMPPERSFPLSFSMCVPYGGRVPSLPRTQAAELEAGKIYYLHIEARPSKGKGTPLAYEARFCLAKQRDGSAVVHQIWSGDREGRRLYGCLPAQD